MGTRKTQASSVGKVILIMVLFIVINVLLLGVIYVQGSIADGVRAYVRGEGLWAKAQKDVVLHLNRYSYNHQHEEFLAYQRALDVISGDQSARRALLEIPPDLERARAGLLRGQNDPQDVDAMVSFFLNFRHESHLRQAIDIWEQADARVDTLMQVANAMRDEIEHAGARSQPMSALREQLQQLNRELLTLENHFSATLSEGARWVRRTTWLASIAILMAVMGVSLVISRQIIRSIARSEQQTRLAATVFAASNDGVLIMDEHLRILSANAALCRMTGYTEPELRDHTAKILQSIFASELSLQDMEKALQEQGHWQTDIIERRHDGALLPLQFAINSVNSNDGVISHYVAIISDITKRKAEEAQLRHIAHHDPLTGLPNRVLFNDRMDQIFKRARRLQGKFAVVYLDLNDFKPVNDCFGHDTGDKLLQTVAARLIENVRGTDTVTRLGGDEFVMLLEDISDRDMVDSIVDKTVTSVQAPCRINDHDIAIEVSVGVALYPDDGTTARTLLHHADLAMYAMKKRKKDRLSDATAADR